MIIFFKIKQLIGCRFTIEIVSNERVKEYDLLATERKLTEILFMGDSQDGVKMLTDHDDTRKENSPLELKRSLA